MLRGGLRRHRRLIPERPERAALLAFCAPALLIVAALVATAYAKLPARRVRAAQFLFLLLRARREVHLSHEARVVLAAVKQVALELLLRLALLALLLILEKQQAYMRVAAVGFELLLAATFALLVLFENQLVVPPCVLLELLARQDCLAGPRLLLS